MSEAAEKYVYLNTPGAYVGPYRNDMAPYMVEPANTLTSKVHEGLIFVGPAQSAKTQALILNFIAYNIIVDPMDMIIYNPTGSAAKDFSIRRLERLSRFSPEIKKAILPDRDADNLYDKRYKSGTILSVGWPTVTQFAGRPVGRLMLTDFDRMPDDVEGDGNPYDLASKRATTFGSFGMTVAESSPSRMLTSPKWIRTGAHEAPPTTGILALYNRGDRRRFYWPCKHCGHWFEGRFKDLKYSERLPPLEAGKTARLVCPSCGGEHKFDDRKEMLARGKWLREGQIIKDGVVTGEGRNARIASFWLNGMAAGFQTWAKLVSMYLDAENEYKKTGSQDALKKFFNNDLGEPYTPKTVEIERLPEVLKDRATRMPEREVPKNGRFLVATIDVQKNMFVVQVYCILPGTPFDLAVIDRFDVRKSNRRDADEERLWVKPASYAEDWQLLIDEVIKKTYPLSDGSGRRMMIKAVGCDSGGREGVTTRAYDFWRSLRGENGLAARFHLLKGVGSSNGPRVVVDYPDARKDRFSGARGDVPVMFLNSNLLKDDLLGRLDCLLPGKGMFLMPDWLPDEFYAEMCAENREEDGWAKPGKTRNEAWDLSYYALGLCVSPAVRVEQIDWSNPVGWAAPWDENSLVTKPGQKERFAREKDDGYDFAALARKLG